MSRPIRRSRRQQVRPLAVLTAAATAALLSLHVKAATLTFDNDNPYVRDSIKPHTTGPGTGSWIGFGYWLTDRFSLVWMPMWFPLLLWIGFTVVVGSIFGTIVAAVAHRSRPVVQPAS